MKVTIATLAMLFSATLVAAQAGRPRPTVSRPSRPTETVVSQSNQCGNSATPFCCTSDNGSYSECFAMNAGSQCSQTIVCCNANNSVQVCLGNANIVLAPSDSIL